MPPTELPGLTKLAAASAIILGDLAAAAGVTVPPVAAAALHPVVFACVDALATGDAPRARRLAGDLWAVVSRPGAFAAGDWWGDEPVYLDGDPVTRRDAADALARGGVDPVGVALFLGTARPAHHRELAAAVAFYSPDQPRDRGRFAPAGGGSSAAERTAVHAEPVGSDTWAGRAGAKTVGEAKSMVAALEKGRRVEHPNGSVGEVTRLRGKPAVKYPDQTVTLDQMGREVQHLKPSDKAPSPTPNPPSGWRQGDHLAVGKDTGMGKAGAKTVGDARRRLARLPDGAKVVTPDGHLARVESAPGADGSRKVSLKALGRPAVALDAIPADQIAGHRPITKDPYQQNLKKDSPARRSLGTKTAGQALHAIEMLPVGTRITDHGTGRQGTLVQYPAGGSKAVKLMRAGIHYDGDPAVTPLDGYTGDRVQHLEAHQEKVTPPDAERKPSGFVELPKRGFIDRILDRAWDALKGGVSRVIHGGAKDQWTSEAARAAAVNREAPPPRPAAPAETAPAVPEPAPAPVPPPAPAGPAGPPAGSAYNPPPAAPRPTGEVRTAADGHALVRWLNTDRSLSLGDVRSGFEPLKALPKKAVADILRKAGYGSSADQSKPKMLRRLLQNLEGIKTSQHRCDRILNGP